MYGQRTIIWKLAVRNIIKQKFQSIILLILLFITSITLFFSEYLTVSMKEGLKETKERLGADLIVVPDRFVTSIEDALFLGKPCTVNFDKDWMKKIARIKGVEKVSYQLYISSLGMDCCDNRLQLIAFDMNSDFVVDPWLSKNGIQSIGKDEIIVGCNMKRKAGDIVKYFGRKFKVIDVLKETGMGYDNCAFISYKAAYDIANDSKYESILPFRKNEQVISMVLVKRKENQSITAMKDAILKKYEKSGINVYSTSDLVSRFADNLNNFVTYGTIFRALSVLLSTVALYGIYSITIHLRKSEFGTYFSFGTGKQTILLILLAELFLEIMLATVTGSTLVCFFTIPFHEAIREKFSIPYLMLNAKEIIWISLKTLFINVTVCGLAAVKSFYELAHLEGIALIRAGNE